MKLKKVTKLLLVGLGMACSSYVLANNSTTEKDILKQQEMQLRQQLEDNMRRQAERAKLEAEQKAKRIETVKQSIFEKAKEKRVEEIAQLRQVIESNKAKVQKIKADEVKPLKKVQQQIETANLAFEQTMADLQSRESAIKSEISRLTENLNAVVAKQNETKIAHEQHSKNLKIAYEKEMKVLNTQPNLSKITELEQQNLEAASTISQISLDSHLPQYIAQNWEAFKNLIPEDIDPNDLELNFKDSKNKDYWLNRRKK